MKDIIEYIRDMVEDAQRLNKRTIVIHAPRLPVIDALKRQVRGNLKELKTLFGYPFVDSNEVWLELDGKPNKMFF